MKIELPSLADGLDVSLGLHIINAAARNARRLDRELTKERFFLRAGEKRVEAEHLYKLKVQTLKHLLLRRKIFRVAPDDIRGFYCFADESIIGWHGFHAPHTAIGSLIVGVKAIPPVKVKAFVPADFPPGYTLSAVENALELYLDSGRGALPDGVKRRCIDQRKARQQKGL